MPKRQTPGCSATLNELKVSDLQKMARAINIPNRSKMNKSQLCHAIQNAPKPRKPARPVAHQLAAARKPAARKPAARKPAARDQPTKPRWTQAELNEVDRFLRKLSSSVIDFDEVSFSGPRSVEAYSRVDLRYNEKDKRMQAKLAALLKRRFFDTFPKKKPYVLDNGTVSGQWVGTWHYITRGRSLGLEEKEEFEVPSKRISQKLAKSGLELKIGFCYREEVRGDPGEYNWECYEQWDLKDTRETFWQD